MLGCRSTGPDAEGEQRRRAGQMRCAGREGEWRLFRGEMGQLGLGEEEGRRTEDARQEEEEGQVGSAKWWPAQSE